ncbi:MAG: hypothetical protein CVU61_13550 [Deltaproteobacteria bacterium HGW-Deltaproteobacteria-19]|nr:MAG: hypothetical protein CVU61_13550 [Deltaproteobacteria bacterium HGW-Deltaproteobacteria-19]
MVAAILTFFPRAVNRIRPDSGRPAFPEKRKRPGFRGGIQGACHTRDKRPDLQPAIFRHAA